MEIEPLYTSDAPEPVGPYSQAMRVGNLLFCSGQIAIDPKTKELKMDSIEEQTKQVMENIGCVLKAADIGYENIVKTAIFLKNMSDFSRVNEIYSTFFSKDFPARSCVEVSGLPKNVDVEIEVIAFIP